MPQPTVSTIRSVELNGTNTAKTIASMVVPAGSILYVVAVTTVNDIDRAGYALDWGATDLTGSQKYSDIQAGLELAVWEVTGLSGTEDLVYDPENNDYPVGAVYAFTVAGGGTPGAIQIAADSSWTSPIQLPSITPADVNSLLLHGIFMETTNQATVTLDPDTSGAVSLLDDATVAGNNGHVILAREASAAAIQMDFGVTGASARAYVAFAIEIPEAGGGGATIDDPGTLNGRQGDADTWDLTSTGWSSESWGATGLPTGISLTDDADGTAQLIGNGTTPAGTYNPTVTLDGASRQLTIVIAVESINDPGTLTGQVGHSEDWGLASSDWDDETWSATGLPTGITLTDNANGTATLSHDGSAAAGSYSPTVTLGLASRQLTIEIAAAPTASGTTDGTGEIRFTVTEGPGAQVNDQHVHTVTMNGVSKQVTRTKT